MEVYTSNSECYIWHRYVLMYQILLMVIPMYISSICEMDALQFSKKVKFFMGRWVYIFLKFYAQRKYWKINTRKKIQSKKITRNRFQSFFLDCNQTSKKYSLENILHSEEIYIGAKHSLNMSFNNVSVCIPRFLTFTFFFFCAWTVTSHGFTVYALFSTVHALFTY